MSRRSKPANRFGCKPDEDVCVAHDMPLECRHGCEKAEPHKCKDKERYAEEVIAADSSNNKEQT